MRIRVLLAAGAAMGALGQAACAPDKAAEPTQASAPAAKAAPRLPVSINAVMVAMVDHAAEPIWVNGYKPPTTNDGWRDLEYNAHGVAVNGKLIQLAGTGPSDAKWVSSPEWIRYADAMSAAGMAALTAARAKDAAAVNTAGDRLVESCEGCHQVFKPELTTGGIYKDPSYPPK